LAAALLAALALPWPAWSQADADQYPPHLRWKRVDSPRFQVIAPEEMVGEAQRVAALLERAYGPVTHSLGVAPPRVQLVLGNQTTQPNGLVSPVLRYSEWFSTPPQDAFSGPVDWYTLLAVHELRHVAQLEKMNTGFNRVLGTLAGQAARVALPSLVVPGWYFEGDATGIETALTAGGRGRLPSFDMRMRADLLSGRRRSYSEALHGSYATWSPTEYELGYLLTTHVKRRHGAEALGRVAARSARRAYNPGAFSSSLRAVTGRTAAQTYQDAMDELESLWRRQLEGVRLTDARVLNPSRRATWTNFRGPQYLADGSVVALRDGIGHRPQLVRIGAGVTTLAELRPSFGDRRVSAAGSRVVWSEVVPDPRWGKRDQTVIRVLDVATGRVRALGAPGKWFSPAVSPDGARVAAVEFTPDRRSSLVVLDAATGAEVRRVAAAAGEVQLTPTWSDDGRSVVVLLQSVRGAAVARVDAATGGVEEILAPTPEPVTRPVLHGGHLFFNSPRSGIDNVYALELRSGRRFQVTSRRFGAFNPAISPDGTRMVFEDYTPDGFDSVEMPLDPASWTPAEQVEDRGIRYYEPLLAQEGRVAPADTVEHAYPVRDFHGSSDLIRPVARVVIPYSEGAFASLFSSNMMNTLELSADVDLNLRRGTSAGEISASYRGWYPIVDVRLRDEQRESTTADDAGTTDEWRERGAGVGVRLPLDFTRGAYARHLAVGVRADVVRVTGREDAPVLRQGNGVLAPLSYSAGFSRHQQRARRDLLPARGQEVRLSYRHTPLGGDYRGSQGAAFGTLFLPGLRAHHGIRARAGHERQDPTSYRFSSTLRFPRGFDEVFHPRLTNASLDYLFPVAYPDVRVGPFTQVQRVTGGLFVDHARGSGAEGGRSYTSAGAELAAEAGLLSLPFRIRAGTRVAYRFGDGRVVAEPILGGSF
jgi:hypothetical protein